MENVHDFLIANRTELKNFILEETSHLMICERIFKNSPELFNEIVVKAQKEKVKEFIELHFDLNREEINVLVSDLNVTLLIQNS